MSAAALIDASPEVPLDEADYYARPSATSRIVRHARHLSGLRGDADDASRLARNVVTELLDIGRLNLHPSRQRLADYNLRGAGRLLDRAQQLQGGSFQVARTPENRVLASCHHLALLACAALRFKNVPARVRNGFAPYLSRGQYKVHSITEVVVDGRWLPFDAALGLGVASPLCRRFLPAAEVWLRYRAGDAALTGLRAEIPFRRIDVDPGSLIRRTLVFDFASLCKVELHPCDLWGMALTGEREPSDDAVDEIARLALDDRRWEERVERFRSDPALRVDGRVVFIDLISGRLEDNVQLPSVW